MAETNPAAGVPLSAWRLGGGRRCGIHGDDTSGGRCETCDRLAAGEVTCVDHWHCDPIRAAHVCDKPDRAAPCPTCGQVGLVREDGAVWSAARARWELSPEQNAAYWAARDGDEF